MAEPSPRYHHLSATVVDKLYVWGGGGGRWKSVMTSIVHHYDPDSETWNANTCEGLHPRGITGPELPVRPVRFWPYHNWTQLLLVTPPHKLGANKLVVKLAYIILGTQAKEL